MSKKYYRAGGKTKRGRSIMYVHEQSQSSSSRSRFFLILKYALLIALICAVIYLLFFLHTNSVIVFFNRTLISEKTIFAIDLNIVDSEISHYLFSILNSLLIGVYLSAVLPTSGKRSKYVTILLIAFVIIFAILSVGYIGIFLYLNLNFLAERIYISNSVQGLIFFSKNIAFFLTLYAISLLIESETD